MSLKQAQYATLGVGSVNVAMTFVSAILMDRAGRRTLHLYGLAVMFIFADLLTVSFLWQVGKDIIQQSAEQRFCCFIVDSSVLNDTVVPT